MLEQPSQQSQGAGGRRARLEPRHTSASPREVAGAAGAPPGPARQARLVSSFRNQRGWCHAAQPRDTVPVVIARIVPGNITVDV